MKQTDIFHFKSANSYLFSTFTSCVTCKWNVAGLTRSCCSFFKLKKYFHIKKRRHQKLTFLINQVVFSFEIRKYFSFAEMNIILMTITKENIGNRQRWELVWEIVTQSAQPWLHESLERRNSYVGKKVWKTFYFAPCFSRKTKYTFSNA